MSGIQAPSRRRTAWLPVLGLLVLSPICAEYLIGYDDGIDDPVALLTGLLILAPLYGAPAVLIREIARRANQGWTTMLILGAAFGLAQAGLIDQSLFHLEFGPDAPAWAQEEAGTHIPLLAIDADQLINFVGGHVIWSFAAPIAVIESYAGAAADRPWLSRVGIGVMAALYLIAAGLIVIDVVEVPASARQLMLTGLVVLAMVVVALKLPPRRQSAVTGAAPKPWIVGTVALPVFAASQLMPTSWGWAGVACISLLLSVLGVLLILWSQRAGWDRRHVLAVAAAALVVRGVLAFAVEPLGQTDYAMKYAMNATILMLIVALIGAAAIRLHRNTIGEM